MNAFDSSPYVRTRTLANAAVAVKAIREEDFADLISSTLVALYGKERATNLIRETLQRIASVQLSVPVQSRTNGDPT
mgnify:FL=1